MSENQETAQTCGSSAVSPEGFEPSTNGLKVSCSTPHRAKFLIAIYNVRVVWGHLCIAHTESPYIACDLDYERIWPKIAAWKFRSDLLIESGQRGIKISIPEPVEVK